MKAVSSDYAPHVSAYGAQFLVSAYTQYGFRKLTVVNKNENIFYFSLDFDRPPPLIIVEVREKLPSERCKRNLKKFQKGLDKRYPKAL